MILTRGGTTLAKPLTEQMTSGLVPGLALSILDLNKVSLAEGRHFGPINQMGFEWYQSHNSNNSIFLRKFGLLYKKPRTDEQWSYSTDFNGESNKEKTGYFFYMRNIGNFERDWVKTRVTAFMKSIFSSALRLASVQRITAMCLQYDRLGRWRPARDDQDLPV